MDDLKKELAEIQAKIETQDKKDKKKKRKSTDKLTKKDTYLESARLREGVYENARERGSESSRAAFSHGARRMLRSQTESEMNSDSSKDERELGTKTKQRLKPRDLEKKTSEEKHFKSPLRRRSDRKHEEKR